MHTLTPVICKGTVPGTMDVCGSQLLLTDGIGFFLSSESGVVFQIELDPPRVKCPVCGYKTRLRYSGRPNQADA
jgi:hypothetical protein